MDDLSLAGYRSADRFVGLDFDHVKLTVAKLAKMHAASAVFVEKVRRERLLSEDGFGLINSFCCCRETVLLRNSSTQSSRPKCAVSWRPCSNRIGKFKGRAW